MHILNSNTLGNQAALLTASRLVSKLISVIIAILLSRFRTLEEYGTFSQLLIVVTLANSFFMLGLPNSLNYFLPRCSNDGEDKIFLSTYYSLCIVLSLVTGIVLMLLSPLISIFFKNTQINAYVLFLGLFPMTVILDGSINNVLIIYKKIYILVIYRFLNSIMSLLPIILIQCLNLSFQVYIYSFLFINLVFSILTYFIIYFSCVKFYFSFYKKLVINIFHFSIPLGLSSIVGTLDIELDKLLIGRLMNTEILAIYTNASKELPITILASSIVAVLMPHLVRKIKNNDMLGAVKLWGEATELSFIIICIIVMGCFTFADDVLELLYSSKYLSGIKVFRIYILVLLFRCTYWGIILNSIGKTKEIFYCSIFALLINVLLNPIFYFFLGMAGPALATFISIIIIENYQVYKSSKYINVKMKDILPWFNLIKIFLINVILALFFYFIKLMFIISDNNIIQSMVLGGIWFIVYLLFMRNRIMGLWKRINCVI